MYNLPAVINIFPKLAQRVKLIKQGDGYMNNIQKVILDIINEKIELPITMNESNLNDSLDKYGINSISFIRLVTLLESKLRFEFDDEYLDHNKFSNIQSVVDYISKKI